MYIYIFEDVTKTGRNTQVHSHLVDLWQLSGVSVAVNYTPLSMVSANLLFIYRVCSAYM